MKTIEKLKVELARECEVHEERKRNLLDEIENLKKMDLFFSPNVGEYYYTVHGSGEVIGKSNNHQFETDIDIGLGSIAATEEQALIIKQQAIETAEVLKRLYALNGDWVADYSDESQVKWYVEFLTKDGRIFRDTSHVEKRSKHVAKNKNIIYMLGNEFGSEAVARAFGKI